ncbi:MAG: branched-chain amino acid ABC transporter permease [Deltaproteobacteria bacterium]|nr:branched-chain amino acid ABC transporter permease [Deltaproteobacteria bacterium]
MLLQQLANGLTLGSIYALFALGYTMVYGVLLMINFAHSEIFMVGAYCGLGILSHLALGNSASLLFVVISAALLAAGLLAVLVERVAYRPLRHAPRLAPLISAIGISIFLQNAVMLGISAQSLPYPEKITVTQLQLGGATVNSLQILIFSLAIGLMLLLNLFLRRTKLGKAMQAIAQNHTVSQLMGINVNAIIALTFFIGGGLGGVAGALNGFYYGSIKYNMGFFPGIKAFTAAVLGGIGNIHGAMLGGFILGILEVFAAGYISSEYKDAIAFLVLIVVLIFRPGGLLGEQITEKI